MLGRLVPLLRVIAIGVPVAGAIPTGINLYHSYKHGIPYAQVSHRLEQYDLWMRNMDCAIEYKELSGGQNAKINIGVCPTNGDISIKVAMPEGKAMLTLLAIGAAIFLSFALFYWICEARYDRRAKGGR